jgi:prepilin-type N-terminal cleavage/methylation domain-containing protein
MIMFQTNEAKNIPSTHSRAAFTLVELLVTISIIAILASLLLAGVSSARNAAINASVKSEISAIESALESFRAEFGSYPPSSIKLYETKAGWDADPNSKAKIKALFPNIDWVVVFDRNNNNNATDGGDFVDFNQNGANDGAAEIVLGPPECLVFFLAGPVINQGTATQALYQPIGFAANPKNPFASIDDSKNRKKGFFEFDNARLLDGDGDSFPGYLDKYTGQTNPIVYLSSYEGQGYDYIEVVNLGVGMKDVYRQVWAFDGSLNHDPAVYPNSPWKEKTFQLISPGRDGQYGLGGYYRDGVPKPATAPAWDDFIRGRTADEDNVTNFAAGQLK